MFVGGSRHDDSGGQFSSLRLGVFPTSTGVRVSTSHPRDPEVTTSLAERRQDLYGDDRVWIPQLHISLFPGPDTGVTPENPRVRQYLIPKSTCHGTRLPTPPSSLFSDLLPWYRSLTSQVSPAHSPPLRKRAVTVLVHANGPSCGPLELPETRRLRPRSEAPGTTPASRKTWGAAS